MYYFCGVEKQTKTDKEMESIRMRIEKGLASGTTEATANFPRVGKVSIKSYLDEYGRKRLYIETEDVLIRRFGVSGIDEIALRIDDEGDVESGVSGGCIEARNYVWRLITKGEISLSEVEADYYPVQAE
jgi:hypothetical protein